MRSGMTGIWRSCAGGRGGDVGALDRFARQAIAIPLLMLGIACSILSEILIRSGAWLCDIDPDAEV